jgi:hypothetical protein
LESNDNGKGSAKVLYKLDSINKDYSRVKRTTLSEIGWKEKDLQDLLSAHIQDFIYSNDLMTISNERPGQEEPDILALDRNGDLHIFELKRWSGKQENLLQVLRYGQLFGNSNYDDLNEMFQKYSQRTNLAADHAQYFSMSNLGLMLDEYNRHQHYVVVTNGLDQATVEAISYWKKNGLNIDAIIYWVFEIGNEFFIEFNTYSPIEGYLEYESNSYVLNTDYSNNPSHTYEMSVERKAAAYYPGWREKIQKLQKGDTVFLYKSGTGIIAYGIANGQLEKRECDEIPDYEYCMALEKFVKLKTPMTASTMKRIADKGFQFRQTMFSISDESRDLIISEIQRNHL